MKWVWLLVLLVTPAWGADVVLLECSTISFFTEPCPPVETPSALAGPIPPPVPLFPPETLARDISPLMVHLLDDPTPENARAFLDWQAQRQARIQEVQHLLSTLVKKGVPAR